MGGLIKLLGGGLVDTFDRLIGRFAGDRTAREAAAHAENMAVSDQFAAEFSYRDNRTWWDSLIDGVNRLPRPLFALGVLGAVFVWPAVDMASFVDYTRAIEVVPEGFWWLAGTVVAFYFGGRMQMTGKSFTMTPEQRTRADALVQEQRFTSDLTDESKPLSDAALARWNADHGGG